METFTPELASQMRTEPLPGVLLTRVRSGSIAATRGLAPGMLITQIQGQTVENVQSLLERLESVGTQSPIRLRVGRWEGQERAFIQRFVVVELPATE